MWQSYICTTCQNITQGSICHHQHHDIECLEYVNPVVPFYFFSGQIYANVSFFRYVGRRIFWLEKIVAHHDEEFVRIPSAVLDVELGKVCLHWGLRSRGVSSTRIRMRRFAEH